MSLVVTDKEVQELRDAFLPAKQPSIYDLAETPCGMANSEDVMFGGNV